MFVLCFVEWWQNESNRSSLMRFWHIHKKNQPSHFHQLLIFAVRTLFFLFRLLSYRQVRFNHLQAKRKLLHEFKNCWPLAKKKEEANRINYYSEMLKRAQEKLHCIHINHVSSLPKNYRKNFSFFCTTLKKKICTHLREVKPFFYYVRMRCSYASNKTYLHNINLNKLLRFFMFSLYIACVFS